MHRLRRGGGSGCSDGVVSCRNRLHPARRGGGLVLPFSAGGVLYDWFVRLEWYLNERAA